MNWEFKHTALFAVFAVFGFGSSFLIVIGPVAVAILTARVLCSMRRTTSYGKVDGLVACAGFASAVTFVAKGIWMLSWPFTLGYVSFVAGMFLLSYFLTGTVTMPQRSLR